MSRAPARFDHYDGPFGRELMIARGPVDAPQLLLIQPLFEEGNFTRTAAADLIDGLVANGVAGWLFDLPGAGDSLAALTAVGLADWRRATVRATARVTEATGTVPHVASIRGGALLDDAGAARSLTRISAAEGLAVLRPLRRAAKLGESAGIGGWAISDALAAELASARPATPKAPLREAAWHGTPPWRRAEPAHDRAATDALARDIAAWIAACDGR